VILVLAAGVGIIFATGTFLLLQRTLSRIVLGLGMYGNGVNLLMMLTGGRAGAPPFADGSAKGPMADPMPQAMSLTTIVINLGIIALLLALAYRSATLTGADEVEDDLEDRRIAQARREEEIVAEIEEEEEEPMPATTGGEPPAGGSTSIGEGAQR